MPTEYDIWKTTPPDCYEPAPEPWEQSDEYLAFEKTAKEAEALVYEVIGDRGNEITPHVTRKGAVLEVGLYFEEIPISEASLAKRAVADALREMAALLDERRPMPTKDIVAELRGMADKAKEIGEECVREYVGPHNQSAYELGAMKASVELLAARVERWLR